MAKLRKPPPGTYRLAAEAQDRKRQGERPTQAQTRALERVLEYREERTRREHLEAVPFPIYVEMAGRDKTTIKRQAETWGFPIDKATVDMFAVVRSFHDFLGEHWGQAVRSKGDPTDWKAEAAKEDAAMRRIKREQLEGQLIAVEDLTEFHNRLIAILRALGDRLENDFGPESRGVLNKTLDTLEREIANATTTTG